jgi:formylglycine-generating enzyme required for sulfatase activity
MVFKRFAWFSFLVPMLLSALCTSTTTPTIAVSPAAPVPVAPANGAVGRYLTLTLTWQRVTNAVSYDVQVAKDSVFSTMVGNDSSVTTDSATVAGLSLDSGYYWRVRAVGGANVSAWSGAWSFTTMAATTFPGMRKLAGGTFIMGDSAILDTPRHSVTVSSFYIDTTPVTQAAYQSLMGVDPAYFGGSGQLPVEQVTWFDAVLYCNARSKRDGLDTVYTFSSITGTPGAGCTALGTIFIDYTRKGYRLPTEAEYEYACRAGNDSNDYYWGRNYPPLTTADTLAIDSNAVWYVNSPNGTQPVALLKPNGFGLYDMSGNVWEWCNDWQGSYSSASQVNPAGPAIDTNRIMRGGSWSPTYAFDLCSGYRGVSRPADRVFNVGFRVVCTAP